jgi:hypothetical protein
MDTDMDMDMNMNIGMDMGKDKTWTFNFYWTGMQVLQKSKRESAKLCGSAYKS